jgi:hypothetical protein
MGVVGFNDVGRTVASIARLSTRFGSDEIGTSSTIPWEVRSGGTSHRRILVLHNLNLLPALLAAQHTLARDVRVATRFGIPTRSFVDFLRREQRVAAAGLSCVVDLHPLGLTSYLSLRAGGYQRGLVDRQFACRFAGIDDRLLAFGEQHLLPQFSITKFGSAGVPSVLCTKLNEFARRVLKKLEREGLQLESLVGTRCATLMREGCGVDLYSLARFEHFSETYPKLFARRIGL